MHLADTHSMSRQEDKMLLHDVRALVNIILSASNLLDQSKLNEEQKSLTDTIAWCAENLQEISTCSLDESNNHTNIFITPEQPRTTVEKLSTQLHSLCGAFALRRPDRSVVIEPDIAPAIESKHFRGNFQALRRILINLVDNALKFTKEGKIIVSVSIEDEKRLRFAVSDDGPGIPIEFRTEIFKPYWKRDNQHGQGGYGLGLSTVYQLVNEQSGNIQVSNGRTGGAVFDFVLPFSEEFKGKSTDAYYSARRVGGYPVGKQSNSKAKILVIDDNRLNQMLLEKALLSRDYEVQIAEAPVQALEILSKYKFDLVLLDVNLCDFNGIALASLIRQTSNGLNRNTPLLGTSGSTLKPDEAKVFDRFLSRPFSNEKMLTAIEELIDVEALSSMNSKNGKKPDFSHLLDFCNGDKIFATDLVKMFLENAPEALHQLWVEVQMRNVDRIAQLAHRLSSNFQLMGLPMLEQYGSTLEILCKKEEKQQHLPTIISLAKELIDATKEILPVVKNQLPVC